jgi:hypothetical protein
MASEEAGQGLVGPPPPAAAETEHKVPSPPEVEERVAEQPSAQRREPRQPARGDYREDFSDEDDDREEGRYARHRPRFREAAKAHVAGPAIALMIVGALAVGLACLGLVINLAGVAIVESSPAGRNQPGEPPAAFRAVTGVIGAVVGFAWGGVVLSAAWCMKNLRSYGYAMAGSIVAMVPCNICCLLGLPFGIWALVVIVRPEVKDAFS